MYLKNAVWIVNSVDYDIQEQFDLYPHSAQASVSDSLRVKIVTELTNFLISPQ